MHRTIVQLDDEVFKTVREYTFKRGQSISGYVREAVKSKMLGEAVNLEFEHFQVLLISLQLGFNDLQRGLIEGYYGEKEFNERKKFYDDLKNWLRNFIDFEEVQV